MTYLCTQLVACRAEAKDHIILVGKALSICWADESVRLQFNLLSLGFASPVLSDRRGTEIDFNSRMVREVEAGRREFSLSGHSHGVPARQGQEMTAGLLGIRA